VEMVEADSAYGNYKSAGGSGEIGGLRFGKSSCSNRK